jgi:1-acyl-sn-glycerol-3-phosphate acyltransferase
MSRDEKLKRRLRSVSIVSAAFVGATVTLPLLLLAGLLYDVVALLGGRRHFMAVRLTLMGWFYLGTEVLGVIALGGLWLASVGGRFRHLFIGGTYVIQRWWAGSVFWAVRTIFGIQVEVEGSALLAPGPIVVFMRHTSIVDNLLPNVLITAPHGIKLRYVLKRELLSDPALDIAGTRLPNYFVDRRSMDPESEIAEIARLGSGLGSDEGVLIYPEGTRFTEARRARALESLQVSNPELYVRAAAMRLVLPPRLRGPLALLEAEPAADVVIAAHAGLDGLSHIRQILGGGLAGNTVRVQFRRFAHGDIPTEPDERTNWLYDRWAEVDAWIANA